MRRPAPREQILELGRSLESLTPGLSLSAVLSIEKGWPSDASETLAGVVSRIREGVLDRELLLPAFEALSEVATETALPALLYGLTAVSMDLRNEAAAGIERLTRHLFRARRFKDLVKLQARLHNAFPGHVPYALDYADALIQYGPDPAAARSLLEGLRRESAASLDTEDLNRCLEIDRGLAMAAFWSGDDWAPFLSPSRMTRDRRDAGDAVKRTLARSALLKGALEMLTGKDGRASFLAALEQAPYDMDFAEIDRLFAGKFSTSNLVWRLNRHGRTEESGRIFRTLVETLREDPSGSAYYPDPPDLESGTPHTDRIRSRLPLHEAFFLHRYHGNPDQAIERLDRYIRSLEASVHPGNMDLLGTAYYDQGLAALGLDQSDAAEEAVQKGIKVYEQLLESNREIWPGAAARALQRYYRRQKARGILYQETLVTIFLGDPMESARLALEACSTAPDFDEAILARAMAWARLGHRSAALDFASNMVPYPDRFYSRACIHALSGDAEAALADLRRHFEAYVEPRCLWLACRYTRRDPDLKVLHGTAEFEHLVRER